MFLLCVEFGCQVGAESPLGRGRRLKQHPKRRLPTKLPPRGRCIPFLLQQATQTCHEDRERRKNIRFLCSH